MMRTKGQPFKMGKEEEESEDNEATVSDTVNLLVSDEKFICSRKLLCENSEYFRAMFTGGYRENKLNEVKLEVIDSHSLKIILEFLKGESLNFTNIDEIGDVTSAARFLQMDALLTHIETNLTQIVNIATWCKIMEVSEESSLAKLNQLSKLFGLLEFKCQDSVEVFESIDTLKWYLSHTLLAVDNELQVYNFGVRWLKYKDTYNDNYLQEILLCLDYQHLTRDELRYLFYLDDIQIFATSLKLIKCLLYLKENDKPLLIDDNEIVKVKQLYEEFTYNNVVEMLKRPSRTGPTVMPAIVMKKCDDGKDYLYRWKRKNGELVKWKSVMEGTLWGYNICNWGTWRVVVSCGEYGRGTGRFERSVRVWDELRQCWCDHGVMLPARRHAAAIVHDNKLYLVGGVGSFRVVLSSAVVYNLIDHEHTQLANIPEEIQCPSIVVHKDNIYVGGYNKIYQLKGTSWQPVYNIQFSASCLASFGNRIYITEKFTKTLNYFNPDGSESKIVVDAFKKNAAAICSTGKELLAFTEDVDMEDIICGGHCYLEQIHFDAEYNPYTEYVWEDNSKEMRYNSIANCITICSLDELLQQI